MQDSNPEVRDSSCGYLSGLLVGLDNERSSKTAPEGVFELSIPSVIDRFSGFLQKKRPQKDGKRSFAGIQGLIAVIRTHPYTVNAVTVL